MPVLTQSGARRRTGLGASLPRTRANRSPPNIDGAGVHGSIMGVVVDNLETSTAFFLHGVANRTPTLRPGYSGPMKALQHDHDALPCGRDRTCLRVLRGLQRGLPLFLWPSARGGQRCPGRDDLAPARLSAWNGGS